MDNTSSNLALPPDKPPIFPLQTFPNDHAAATIAFRTFGAIVLVYEIALLKGTESSHTDNRELTLKVQIKKAKVVETVAKPDMERHATSVRDGSGIITHAISGPFAYTQSGSSCYALPAETLVLLIYYTSQPPQEQYQQFTPPWWAFGAISASIVLLYNEYRLMVPGLVWGATGLPTIGVVRALSVIQSWHEFGIEARLQRFHGFIIMTLLSSLVVSSATA